MGALRRSSGVVYSLYAMVLGICVVAAIGLLVVGGSSKKAPAARSLATASASTRSAVTKPAGHTTPTPVSPSATAPSASTGSAEAPTTPTVTPTTAVPLTIFLKVNPQSGIGCTAGITGGKQWIKYKVQRGDTLTAIARCFDLNGYTTLYAQNESLIGANPNLIFPGQVFTIVNGVMTAADPA